MECSRGGAAGSWSLVKVEQKTLRGGSSLADNAPWPLAGGGAGRRPRRIFKAADRDFEACDAFVAGHRRQAAASHGAQERDQFGAQRLVMADRQVAHRVATVGLEAETFRHLAGQEVA